MVGGLVRLGDTPERLAQDFAPRAPCIRSWVKQADLDEGKRRDGLTSAECDELVRLRLEIREEAAILGKFAAWSAHP